jgi:glycosyltransferase involved in cell wall biosynthesis
MWRHAPWLYERIERRLVQDLDHVFTVRQTAVERYRRIYPHLASRISFLPTWVDTTVFSPARDFEQRTHLQQQLRAKFGLPESLARILVFVGRLDKQKDPQLLLEAFRLALDACSGLHLLIVGDGILRAQIERTCTESGLSDRVTLLGVRSPAEIAEIHRGSDLFVLSSAYEGMPIAVLEALATGLPVVSTQVGEIPLVVRNGISGQISDSRTPQSLATAICTALARIDDMTGLPCETAVAPYRPEKILNYIYDNHRAEAQACKSNV